jgi:hypothetical protein
VDWDYSPRLIWIHWTDAASRELVLQDLYDTMKTLEALTANMDNDFLGNAEGLTPLGGGQSVAITVTLNNALVAFDPNIVQFGTGIATANDPAGTLLTDAAAQFITDGYRPGFVIDNEDDHSHATVLSVLSETQLRTTPLYGGVSNEWHIGDEYDSHEVLVCSVTGGNLVANDAFGNQLDEPILPTSNIFVTKTSSASATLMEQSALRYSSYAGGVTYSLDRGEPGTDYPVGTREHPSNSIPNCVTIAANKFDTIYVEGDLELKIGDDVEDLTLMGNNQSRCHITILDAALTHDCEIVNATVSGIVDGNTVIRSCRVGNINYIEGELKSCLLVGTLVLTGVSETHIIDCASGLIGSYPVIDFGGGGQDVGVRAYNGGLRLTNMASGYAVIDMASGHVIVDPTVTGGTIVIRGVCSVVDNSTGAAVIDTADVVNPMAISDQVWDEQSDLHTASGSFGAMLNLVQSLGVNRLELAPGTTNNWILYKNNGTDELMRWSVTDPTGGAITIPEGTPARRTAGVLVP